jgi:ketol-acid reductoisomerase
MKNFGIIGFGNQATSWALNLADSNFETHVITRNKKKIDSIITHELKSESIANFNYLALLTPDHTHLEILKSIYANLMDGAVIILAHGYSYTYQELKVEFPKLNFALLAPKAIGSELRNKFLSGQSLGAVMSTEGCTNETQQNTNLFIKKLAKAIGITHGPYPVSFEQETIADLVSEQSILCSLLPYGALASYNQLRKMDIPKELAYFECWYEVKLIAETMIKVGPEKFFELISPNALIGSEVAREIFFDQQYFKKLEKLASDIKEKKFTKVVDSTDVEELKKKVLNFWSKQELSSLHKEMGPELYN